uniref:Succinate dehydrogenase [ubiquinone] cytochrome b small subunit n=1 Tax=Podosphaera xanthii TaxID=135283 RepID=A0A7G1GH00_9PEZI|nr:succinate dehydrogenase subunit D [Podosphaera xanthii]BCA25619.1 succinate dehydrogenase subunit D [Podosphaera xanthii]
MASIIRPAILRQRCSASTPTLSTKISTGFLSIKPVCALPRVIPQDTTIKDTIPSVMRVAGFHSSSKNLILPPLPQVINGTANDAAPIPTPEPSHGSYHWTFERLVSVGLVPLTIAPFAAGSLNPTLDACLCGAILIRSHIGFEAVIIDYIPRKRLPKTRVAFWWGLRAVTVAVGVGLYEFETNDVGITEAIKRIWTA